MVSHQAMVNTKSYCVNNHFFVLLLNRSFLLAMQGIYKMLHFARALSYKVEFVPSWGGDQAMSFLAMLFFRMPGWLVL